MKWKKIIQLISEWKDLLRKKIFKEKENVLVTYFFFDWYMIKMDYRNVSSNSSLNRELKFCILGEGGVGKSCLVHFFFSFISSEGNLSFRFRLFNLFKEFLFPNMIQLLKMFIERFSFSHRFSISLNWFVLDSWIWWKNLFFRNSWYCWNCLFDQWNILFIHLPFFFAGYLYSNARFVYQ